MSLSQEDTCWTANEADLNKNLTNVVVNTDHVLILFCMLFYCLLGLQIMLHHKQRWCQINCHGQQGGELHSKNTQLNVPSVSHGKLACVGHF